MEYQSVYMVFPISTCAGFLPTCGISNLTHLQRVSCSDIQICEEHKMYVPEMVLGLNS